MSDPGHAAATLRRTLAAFAGAAGDDPALRALAEELDRSFSGFMAAVEERETLLRRLTRIQHSISGRGRLEDTLDAIVRGAAELVDAPMACLELADPDAPDLTRIVSAVGLPEWRNGMPPGAVSAPVHEDGRVVGTLSVAAGTPARAFSASEQEVLLAFAEHASLALTDARMVADARHRALHDPLTGLPNRTLFLDRLDAALQRARRQHSKVAVLFVDLDGFKRVNDTLGHEVGDEVLAGVARRLRGALRRSDTVARLGGDEFGVIVEDLGLPSDAARAAEQVAAALERPIVGGGRPHAMQASIGTALSGIDGDAPDELLRCADAEMYRAKSRRTGGGLRAVA